MVRGASDRGRRRSRYDHAADQYNELRETRLMLTATQKHVATLRAENARLRALLEQHGIEPGEVVS